MPLRESSDRQIATDSVELRRTLASCARGWDPESTHCHTTLKQPLPCYSAPASALAGEESAKGPSFLLLPPTLSATSAIMFGAACPSATFRRAPKRKSSGLKLFGI